METMYADAVSKAEFTPDIVVLNLGTNDAMREPDFTANYQKFLTMLRNRYPDVYIICLYSMMVFSNNIVSGIEESLKNLSDPKLYIIRLYLQKTEMVLMRILVRRHKRLTAQCWQIT